MYNIHRSHDHFVVAVLLFCSCSVEVEIMVMGCIHFILLLWQYNNLSSLNNTSYLSSNSEYQKFNAGLTGPRSKYWQGVLFSGGSRGGSIFLPFPVSRGCPYSWAHNPLPRSSKTAMSAEFFSCCYPLVLTSTSHSNF